ncbi:hypothetical protein [Sulfurimonas sp.]|uniref:hypothetical protein n=1 Tax=Sulfurimonas sp. TaxID=2022749 RepID=UPI003D0B04B3
MQYDYILVLILLIIIFFLVKYIVLRYKKNVFLKNRDTKTIKSIYEMLESEISYELFQTIWLKIAKIFKLPPEKLKLDDTIEQLSLLSFSPEYIEDILQKELEAFGINNGELTIHSTLKDMVYLVSARKNKE